MTQEGGKKTIYSTKLKQRRVAKESDDIGVVIVNALDTATRQHLKNIGASEEDQVFLAITAHDFQPRVPRVQPRVEHLDEEARRKINFK